MALILLLLIPVVLAGILICSPLGFLQGKWAWRALLLALALGPVILIGYVGSTECDAERAKGVLDCDTDVAEVFGVILVSPIWWLVIWIGARFAGRRSTTNDTE